MYQLKEEIETIDLYVVPREMEYVEHWEPVDIGRIINRVLCLLCLPWLLLIPSWQDMGPWQITVPLQLLPPQQFTATVPVGQSGTRVTPATNARGMLTAYNGSFLVQQLPKGFIVEATGGVTLMTDASVTIPAGDPPNYGTARVQAHAVVAGRAGNVRALATSVVFSSSLYLKNITAFIGGADSYAEQYATEADRAAALSSARYRLKQQAKQPNTLLEQPCEENVTLHDGALNVMWQCQLARYGVPRGLHVVSVKRAGNDAELEVRR